jgi:DNA polymerase IV
MSDNELTAKEAFFEQQALLDVSDDEQDVPNESLAVLERALEDSKAMPPPTMEKTGSSFLGPTPKERRAEFDAHTAKNRTLTRESGPTLARSSTAPEAELMKTFPVIKPGGAQVSHVQTTTKLKRVASLPDIACIDQTPFYKQLGIVPRELKNGKNVKLADNIKLEPEHKQLLKDKVVYFYPNDDISMVRRMRIHKIIQLGAAWVNRWRDDVTHIMMDDSNYTYGQLLRHLNKAGFSVSHPGDYMKLRLIV